MHPLLMYYLLLFLFYQVDIPLSYGVFDVKQDSSSLNTCEFDWDPTKEVGVYIKVRSQCCSCPVLVSPVFYFQVPNSFFPVLLFSYSPCLCVILEAAFWSQSYTLLSLILKCAFSCHSFPRLRLLFIFFLFSEVFWHFIVFFRASKKIPLSLNMLKYTSHPSLILGDNQSLILQVNCISTEFTPKKHGGEKGVPFRIQVSLTRTHACKMF